MAVVAVTFDGTIISGAESESDGGVWDKWGATQSPVQEDNFVWQGDYSISNKISNTTGGMDFDDAAPLDYTTPKVILAKIMITTTGAIDLAVAEGQSYQIGSGGSDYYNYFLAGLYAGAYPLTKSWLVLCINPNLIAFRDEIAGTPVLSAIDYYGHWVKILGLVKSENIMHDRLDYLTNGTGLTLVGGDGANADGVFQDFLDKDFETQLNRYAVIVPGEVELIINGVLTIGSATATVFNDSNKFLVFPRHLVGEGFCGIDIGMAHASNDINFNVCVFKGLGNASTKKFFDTSLEVDGTGNDITLPSHGFNTGDYVLYSKEGGADAIGLTDATYYFVRVIDVDTLSFYAVGATVGRQDSFTDTSRISLTAATAPGENHSIIRSPDNRPDHTVTGTTGIGAKFTQCSLDGARIITLTSKASIEGGFILNTGQVIASTAIITGVAILDPTTTEGAALFTALSSLNNISECDIEAGDNGHAFEITTGGSHTSNNTFSGFWSPSENGWKFATTTGVNDSTDVITTNANHGFTTGDPVYYNKGGGSAAIGLTDGNKYYVNVASPTTVTLHLTKAAAVAGSSKINLTGAGAETHSLYSGNATIYNNSGSAATINVTTGSSAPSIRNGSGASTTVQSSVNLTVKVQDEDQDPIQDVQTSIRLLDSPFTELMNEDTLVTGIATQPYNYLGDVDIVIKARKSDDLDDPRYEAFSAVDKVTSNGFDLIVTLKVNPVLE